MLTDSYSKDLSKKVKSAKRIKMKNGEYIVASAIFGYCKNESGKWEPDPEPAEVVRQIFQMALDGFTTSQIRDRMCAERRLTPREYTGILSGKEVEPKYMWSTRMIYRMLTNEQYTGCYISGKHELKEIGSGARRVNDRSDWIVIPGSHPAIVSKEDFEKTQDMLKNPKELSPKNLPRAAIAKSCAPA